MEAKWLDKDLLDLSIQQEQPGPLSKCKFIIESCSTILVGMSKVVLLFRRAIFGRKLHNWR